METSNDLDYNKKSNQENEIITEERATYFNSITFNGRLIDAPIDTGADKSLIRKELLNDSDFSKMKPSLSIAKLFDGSEVNLLGYVNLNRTNDEGLTVKMRFYVVAELPYPMILGVNWIQGRGQISRNKVSRVEVSEIGTVDALIDSGSAISVVARDVLSDPIKSKITRGTCKTGTLLDGSEIDLLGRVNLTVSYLGRTVALPFYVVDKLFVPMVLGTTWIRKSRAVLQSDGRQLGVTFSGKKEKLWSKWFCRTDHCFTPRVPVNVEGVGMVSALVDTGAFYCSIKRDMLTEIQMSKAVPTSRTRIMANGSKTKTVGLVGLNITFQEITTCIENVDIASKLDDQLVLGMDWIHKTRAVIQSDGSKIIVSQPDLSPKKKSGKRLITWLSKKWNSTLGSVSRISSLVSNLM